MTKEQVFDWLRQTKNLSYVAGGCGVLMMEIMSLTVSLPYTLLANIFIATGAATLLKGLSKTPGNKGE